jgi:hypothetical protein
MVAAAARFSTLGLGRVGWTAVGAVDRPVEGVERTTAMSELLVGAVAGFTAAVTFKGTTGTSTEPIWGRYCERGSW